MGIVIGEIGTMVGLSGAARIIYLMLQFNSQFASAVEKRHQNVEVNKSFVSGWLTLCYGDQL